MRQIIVKTVKYALFCAAIVGLRGYGLASIIDGRYPAASYLADTAALLALMGVCHLFYFLFQRLLDLCRITARPARLTLQLLFVVFAAFPFLVAAIQLHPQKIAGRQNPKSAGVAYEDVEFGVEGLRLKGWLLNPQGEKPPLLLLHGLNANKGNFLPIAAAFSQRGFPVLIFDFEAHGESDGRQTAFGFVEKRDVRAGALWLKERFPNRAPVAVGYSLGGTALLQAQSDDPLFHRFVIDSTYCTLREVADEKLFTYLGPIRPLIWMSLGFWGKFWSGQDISAFDNRAAVKRLDPDTVWLIHGMADRLIPIGESRKLKGASSDRIQLWEIPDADHLQTVADPKYFEAVDRFLLPN